MGREAGASSSPTGRVARRPLLGLPPREPPGGRIRVLDSLLGQVAIAQVGKVLNKGVADLRNVDRILEEKIAKLRERKAELMLEHERDEDPRGRIEEALADHANDEQSNNNHNNNNNLHSTTTTITSGTYRMPQQMISGKMGNPKTAT